MDIEALAPKLASSLSLFEKQLLAIGKALVRPDLALVLLDEPLTAVEPRVKWKLRKLLREVQKEEGTTMLYSSVTTGQPKGVRRKLTKAPPGDPKSIKNCP